MPESRALEQALPMTNFMRGFAKEVLGKCGLDVKLTRNIRAHESATYAARQQAMWSPFLAHHDIRTVIDVGANTGQFAGLIHRLCHQARILSFEPVPDCLPELNATLASIPGSKAFPIALGEKPGSVRMNHSVFTPCSSLLAGTDRLGEDYPDAALVQSIEVPLERLDDTLSGEQLDPGILVKLDVQGYEVPVIRGATAILNRAAIVVVEVCFFRRLYEGQPLFDDIYGVLKDLGFTYMGNPEQHCRKSDGRIVEADAVFERLAD